MPDNVAMSCLDDLVVQGNGKSTWKAYEVVGHESRLVSVQPARKIHESVRVQGNIDVPIGSCVEWIVVVPRVENLYWHIGGEQTEVGEAKSPGAGVNKGRERGYAVDNVGVVEICTSE